MNQLNPPPDKTKRGSSLILVVFILFLVMLVVSAVYMLARRNLLGVNEDYWSDKASFAARAGVEHAIAHLTTDPHFGSMVLDTLPTSSIQDEPDLTYTVEILNNDNPAPNAPPIPAPDGVDIPAGICWVRSTGNLRDRVDSKSTSIVKLVGYQRPILKQALFGMDKITVSGNSTVQGWNSMATPAWTAGAPVVVPYKGSIGTNSTLANAIEVNSGANVEGEARAGVGTLPAALGSVVNPSGGTITGVPPGPPALISQEATQIPRFIIDAAHVPPLYEFRMGYGKGYLPAEDPAKYYYHRLPVDANPLPPDQVSTSILSKNGPDGTPLAAIGDPNDDYANYYVAPPGPTPEQTAAEQQIHYRPYLPVGFYNLDPGAPYPAVPSTAPEVGAGKIVLEDVILRRTNYYFKGDVTLKGHINVDPAVTTAGTSFPCVIYVDGQVTIDPGAKINWDGYPTSAPGNPPADINNNGETDEPLQSRLLQIYSVLDKGEDFNAATHDLVIGATGGPRTKVSFVACGANMIVKMHETDFFGGAQSNEVFIQDNSKAYFDTDLYGKPLEGRGELAVLVSTVSVDYGGSSIAAAGPPAPAAPVPAGPSAPAPTSYTGSPGWCSPMIPIPYNSCAY